MYVLIYHGHYMARTQHKDKEVKLVTSHSSFIKHKHTKHYEGESLQNWKILILTAGFGCQPFDHSSVFLAIGF